MSGAATLLAGLPGTLLGGAADRQAALEGADTAIRAPLALARRIGFVQLAGGVGASTTAAGVATLIAQRRAARVLAVDAAAGPRSLGWQLGTGDTDGTAPDPLRLAPRSQAEALSGLPLTAAGVAVLDVHGDDAFAVSEGAWAEQVAPLFRFCPVVCTDWGVRPAGADLGGILAASNVLCIVTRSDRAAVERAAAAASAAALAPHRPLVVVAVVDVGRSSERPTLDGDGPAVVRVPYEPARRSATPVRPGACSAGTRSALIRLAAALMRQPGREAP